MKTKSKDNYHIELGCGLIRIGRIWGVDDKPVPSEAEAQSFLEEAYDLGIRFFDTAPSYGLSEQRLGTFIKQLSSEQKKEVRVATKFGEHWDAEKNEPYVDHSYDALARSLEQSLNRLGRLALLQLHKATLELLEDFQVSKAFDHAQKAGVQQLGVSVSDVETGFKAASDNRFDYIQLPYNSEKSDLLPVIESTKAAQKQILFNRPLAMGGLAHSMKKAYWFIIKTQASGVILSGTANPEHLQENLRAFQSCL